MANITIDKIKELYRCQCCHSKANIEITISETCIFLCDKCLDTLKTELNKFIRTEKKHNMNLCENCVNKEAVCLCEVVYDGNDVIKCNDFFSQEELNKYTEFIERQKD